eukprot:m.163734 g.163734  ORF g.163734 m.163734 type:complete len:485 (-) comp31302_c0_seq1:142-1596(-)
MWTFLVAAFVALIVYDYFGYLGAKGKLSGASYLRCGLLGIYPLFDIVLHPVEFWQRQTDYNRNGISTNWIMGHVMYYVTNSKISKHIFTNVNDFILYAHPNSKFLFGAENLIYMDPDVHKSFRVLILPGVYGPTALKDYLGYQIRVVRKHLARLADGTSPEIGRGKINDGVGMTDIRAGEFEARLAFRLMNADASQESFCGPYLTQSVKDQLSEDILTFTMGFLCFPLPLPFTGLGKAIAARERIRQLLMPIAQTAKDYVKNGGTPRCVMDYWAKELISNPRGFDVDNADMASTVLDFLFASQDATTSAAVWALDILEERPEIVKKIREELAEKSKGKGSFEDYFQECSYLHSVAYEVLRYRPPVPMVPHMAKKTVTLEDGTVIAKGQLIIPSIVDSAANEEGADTFAPGGKYKDETFRTVLVFGQGPHMCPGRKYAWQLLATFIAISCSEFEFKRRKTSKSSNTVFFPTLFPEDNLYSFTARK